MKNLKHIFTLIGLFSLGLSSYSQVNRVCVMEEYTTTRCGFCPVKSFDCESWVENNEDNAILLSNHAGFGVDAMTNPTVLAWQSAFGTSFAPAITVNRFNYGTTPNGDVAGLADTAVWESVAFIHIAEMAPLTLGLYGDYNSSSGLITGEIHAKFVVPYGPEALFVSLIIMEDSVTGDASGTDDYYDQDSYITTDPSYPELFGVTGPIPGYIHRHVVRANAFSTFGEPGMIDLSPVVDSTYVIPFTYTVPAQYDLTSGYGHATDIDEIELVAFISRSDSVIIQAIKVHLFNLQTSGFNEADDASRIMQLFPNPSKDVSNLIFYMHGGNQVSYELLDISGKIVAVEDKGLYSGGEHQIIIDTESLAGGSYILNLKIGEQVLSRKLLVGSK
ncbi:T9SS type A sorting domain-containing protein [Crocinitomix catalasitica]|nr:T9SS type A sorting domain-containing protein [Crocinitomix catalasitica]